MSTGKISNFLEVNFTLEVAKSVGHRVHYVPFLAAILLQCRQTDILFDDNGLTKTAASSISHYMCSSCCTFFYTYIICSLGNFSEILMCGHPRYIFRTSVIIITIMIPTKQSLKSIGLTDSKMLKSLKSQSDIQNIQLLMCSQLNGCAFR